jgi:hypothetical protein
MSGTPTLIAGALIAAAILLNGYLHRQTNFQLSAAGTDGQTVWRIDATDGRVSMCGSMVAGPTFGQEQARVDAAMMSLAKDAPKEATDKVISEARNLDSLSNPRCTDWSSD